MALCHTNATCPTNCHHSNNPHQSKYTGMRISDVTLSGNHQWYVNNGYHPSTAKSHNKYSPKEGTRSPWSRGAAVEVDFSKKLSLDLSKNKLIPTQYNNIVDNTQVGLGKPCGYQVGVPPRIPVSNLPPHHAFLPASNQLDSNYFACFGSEDELHYNRFVFNVLPDC